MNKDILDRCLSLRCDDLFGIGGHLQEFDESHFNEMIVGSAKGNNQFRIERTCIGCHGRP